MLKFNVIVFILLISHQSSEASFLDDIKKDFHNDNGLQHCESKQSCIFASSENLQYIHKNENTDELLISMRNDCTNDNCCLEKWKCTSFTSGQISSSKSYGYGSFDFSLHISKEIKDKTSLQHSYDQDWSKAEDIFKHWPHFHAKLPRISDEAEGSRRHLLDPKCTVNKIHSKKKCGGSTDNPKASQGSCADRARERGVYFFAYRSGDRCQIPKDDPYKQCRESPSGDKKYSVYEIVCPPPTQAPTVSPTEKPSPEPSFDPSRKPTESPTTTPTESPSNVPTKLPSKKPVVSTTTTDPAEELSETISIMMQFVGVTEENKDAVCDSVADSLNGICSYASLDGPSSNRRRLLKKNLYMDINVKNAEEATALVQSADFASTLDMPEGVIPSEEESPDAPENDDSPNTEENESSPKVPEHDSSADTPSGDADLPIDTSSSEAPDTPAQTPYTIESTSFKSVYCKESPGTKDFPSTLGGSPGNGYCEKHDVDLENFASNRDICQGSKKNICGRYTWKIKANSPNTKIEFKLKQKEIDYDISALFLDGEMFAEGDRKTMANFEVLLETEGVHTVEVYGWEPCCAGNNKDGYKGWILSQKKPTPMIGKMVQHGGWRAFEPRFSMGHMKFIAPDQLIEEEYIMDENEDSAQEYEDSGDMIDLPWVDALHCITLFTTTEDSGETTMQISMCFCSRDGSATFVVQFGDDRYEERVELPIDILRNFADFQIKWRPDCIVCFCGEEKISELRLDSFPIPNQAMHLQAYVVPHHPFQSNANVQHDLHLKSIKYHAFSDEGTFAMTQGESHTTHGWTIFIILLTVVLFACGIYSISTATKDIPAGYINLAQGEYQRDF